MLGAGFPKPVRKWVACVWREHVRGVKPTLNVPVRESHAPKRQGYPQYLPMVRHTNAFKRREIQHSAKRDWEWMGPAGGLVFADPTMGNHRLRATRV